MMCEKLDISDILQPLPLEEWSLLRDTLKQDWPTFSYLYYWIDNAISWKEKQPHLKYDIFCPYGKYNTGVFFGISKISTTHIVGFTFEYSQELFFKCVIETSQISWSENPTFLACHEKTVTPILLEALNYLQKTNGIEITNQVKLECYFKTPADCFASPNIEIPNNYQLKTLDVTHVPTITSVFPFTTTDNYEITFKFIKQLVTMNSGIGLFTEQNELVSWTLKTEWNNVGVVQTIEKYKHKGFAKIVISALSLQLAKSGIDPQCFILKDNFISLKLFNSLGWKKYTDARRIDVKLINNKNKGFYC